MTIDEFLRRAERRYLLRLMRKHPRVSDAAVVAGVNRTSLYRLLDAYGIPYTKRPRRFGNEAWQQLADTPLSH